MGGLRDGKSPAALAAYGRQGPRTVSEPKIRKPPTCRSHGAQMRFKPYTCWLTVTLQTAAPGDFFGYKDDRWRLATASENRLNISA
jgi:hypothetical protein